MQPQAPFVLASSPGLLPRYVYLLFDKFFSRDFNSALTALLSFKPVAPVV